MDKLVKVFDTFFNKVIPKKFTVLVLATIFVFKDLLDGDLWAYIAMFYMATNGIQHLGFNLTDIIKAKKGT